MFTVCSGFICDFKLGDNIIYNLKVLSFFYEQYNASEDIFKKRLLLKPITIFLVSIMEAVLYDFHLRIKNNTSEGVINLKDDVLNYIRGKKIDELEKYIVSARKHNLFDADDNNLYDMMDKLRKLRNRIHIQNIKKDFDRDEVKVFTVGRKELAEKVLEIILKQMNRRYSRDPKFKCVDDFNLPWPEHYEF